MHEYTSCRQSLRDDIILGTLTRAVENPSRRFSRYCFFHSPNLRDGLERSQVAIQHLYSLLILMPYTNQPSHITPSRNATIWGNQKAIIASRE